MCTNGSRRILCMVVGLALFSAAAVADDKITIRRMFHPGKKVYLEKRETLHIVQKMPNMPQSMDYNMSAIKGVWEQAESDGSGGTKVVLTFDRASQEFAMPNMDPVVYDTDDPDYIDASPMFQTIFDNMVGESLTMIVDADGKVTSLTGMDELNKKISEKAAGNMFWPQMSQEFTNQSAQAEWGDSLMMYYPNRDIAVGETWHSSIDMDMPQMGELVTSLDLALKGTKEVDGRKMAEVVYKGTVASKDKDAASKVDGTMSGVALYDIESGMFVRDEQKGEWMIEMPSPMGGEGKMEMTLRADAERSAMSEAERAVQRKEEAAQRAAERKAAEEEDSE